MLKTTKTEGGSTVPAELLEKVQSSLRTLGQSISQIRAHEQLLQAAGVRVDRAGVGLLFKLYLHDTNPLRVTTLAGLLGVDAPTVTRKVQQLERLGYVTRAADPDDGRATRIQLTETGREILERVLAAHRDLLSHVFEPWSEDDLRTFATMLGRFSTALQATMETASE